MDDLFSSHLDLFILCPNGRSAQVRIGCRCCSALCELYSSPAAVNCACVCLRGLLQGVNTEKYVPNPRHTSPQALAMYEFVGRLMGVVLRHKAYLPFEFPPIVWELLAGHKPRRDTLAQHDVECARFLQAMSACTARDQAEFEAAFNLTDVPLYFNFRGCDDVVVELMQGGNERVVSFGNFKEYLAAVWDMRLHEFDAACAAMRRGLVRAAVPVPLWRALKFPLTIECCRARVFSFACR